MPRKSIVVLFLLIFMSFCWTGCGGQTETGNNSASPSAGESGYIDVDSVGDENADSYDKYSETQTTSGGNSTGENSSGNKPADSGNTTATTSNATNNVTDDYQTTPVPEGKPQPVEPQEAKVNEASTLSCTMYIECSKIFDNLEDLDDSKLSVLPSDGVIYAKKTVTFAQGESVFDILARETKNNGLHLEFTMTPGYNSNYIQGIGNLYEMDCGPLSGWMYSVNGWFPNYGSSRYQVQDGDTIEWHYTCDMGRDFGQTDMNR